MPPTFYKLREFSKLIRVHSVPITALLPVYGAICMGETSILLISQLFFIGVLFHCWGFILNDYIDVKIDRLSKGLSEKPLVKRTLSKREAITASFVCIAIAFTFLFLLGKFPSILTFGISVVLGTIYNLYSKRVAGMEVFAAGAFSFLFLFGAVVASHETSLIPLVFIMFSTIFIQQLIENGLFGGLKDCKHDHLMGITTISRLGARIDAEKNNCFEKR